MEGGLGKGIPASRTSSHTGMEVGKSMVDLESLKCILLLDYKVLHT